ncbi:MULTISPECIES: hypothetical protein [Thermomonosporaceae]|nr:MULTISPECIES: hypothetical protein [Thermomonosporaceae]MDL4772472.1 hypothetical protein [Actinomadura xylanilytica]
MNCTVASSQNTGQARVRGPVRAGSVVVVSFTRITLPPADRPPHHVIT